MAKIINLADRRSIDLKRYQQSIDDMSKLELLEEMVRFQMERSDLGRLTLPLILKGQILFEAIANVAETQDMYHMVTAYSKHLALELERIRNETV